MRRHFFISATLAVVLFSPALQAQDYDSAKVLMDQILGSMKGITKTLETINDEKGVTDSLPILELQVQELRGLQDKTRDLKLTDEEKKKLAGAYKLKLTDQIKIFSREVIRISKMPDGKGKPIVDLLKTIRPR